MIIRYPACDLGDQCTCAMDADSGGMPEPGCLWFFWGKRDDDGLTEVLAEALDRLAALKDNSHDQH